MCVPREPKLASLTPAGSVGNPGPVGQAPKHRVEGGFKMPFGLLLLKLKITPHLRHHFSLLTQASNYITVLESRGHTALARVTSDPVGWTRLGEAQRSMSQRGSRPGDGQ